MFETNYTSTGQQTMAKKLGIRALHELFRKACQLFALFTPIAYPLLPENKKVYWDAANQACSDFVLNIDPADFYGDE